MISNTQRLRSVLAAWADMEARPTVVTAAIAKALKTRIGFSPCLLLVCWKAGP